MVGLKNMYENLLLHEYTQTKLNENSIESIIQDYTQARIKECMLKPEFATALKGPHAGTYMKLLRESITDELKLAQSATIDEFNWIPE